MVQVMLLFVQPDDTIWREMFEIFTGSIKSKMSSCWNLMMIKVLKLN